MPGRLLQSFKGVNEVSRTRLHKVKPRYYVYYYNKAIVANNGFI